MSERDDEVLAEWTLESPCAACGRVVRVRRVLEVRTSGLTLAHVARCGGCAPVRMVLLERDPPPPF